VIVARRGCSSSSGIASVSASEIPRRMPLREPRRWCSPTSAPPRCRRGCHRPPRPAAKEGCPAGCATATVAAALEPAGVGGCVHLVGSVFPSAEVPLDPEQTVRRQLTIRGILSRRCGSWRSAAHNFRLRSLSASGGRSQMSRRHGLPRSRRERFASVFDRSRPRLTSPACGAGPQSRRLPES
jgi:hypothetical protein